MYLYSALFIVSHTQGAQAWITQCYLQVQDRESSPVKDRRSTNCATQPTVLMFSWTEMRTVLIDVKKCHLYCCLTLDVLLVATSWNHWHLSVLLSELAKFFAVWEVVIVICRSAGNCYTDMPLWGQRLRWPKLWQYINWWSKYSVQDWHNIPPRY